MRQGRAQVHVQVSVDVSGTSFAKADSDRQLLRPSSQQLHASLEGVALPQRRQHLEPLDQEDDEEKDLGDRDCLARTRA